MTVGVERHEVGITANCNAVRSLRVALIPPAAPLGRSLQLDSELCVAIQFLASSDL